MSSFSSSLSSLRTSLLIFSCWVIIASILVILLSRSFFSLASFILRLLPYSSRPNILSSIFLLSLPPRLKNSLNFPWGRTTDLRKSPSSSPSIDFMLVLTSPTLSAITWYSPDESLTINLTESLTELNLSLDSFFLNLLVIL